MPPLITVVGRKNSGKTTLVVQLAAELRRRGLRVMTIKHGSHNFNIDCLCKGLHATFQKHLAVFQINPHDPGRLNFNSITRVFRTDHPR